MASLYLVRAPGGGGGGTPSIASVSGTVSQGSSLTISGSGFGTVASATPVIHDEFQSQTLGNAVNTNSDWSAWTHPTQDYNPAIANTRLRSGTPFSQVWMSRWTHPDVSAQGTCSLKYGPSGVSYSKYLLSFWAYYDSSAASSFTSPNIKIYRAHVGNDGSPNEYVSTDTPPGDTSGDAHCHSNDGASPGEGGYCNRDYENGNVSSSPFMGTEFWDQWNKYTIISKASNGATPDGGFILYINDVLRWYRPTDTENMSGTETAWNTMNLGNYIRSDAGDWAGTVRAYLDTMHFDTEWKRVEIGNASTYSACTHREIMKTTSWSSTSIGVTFNRGSFAVASTPYLFVVDNNNVASAGYQVTVS